jgi:hypothetical protein
VTATPDTDSVVPADPDPDTDSAGSWTTPRARLAGYKRQHRPESDPDVVATRRELRAAKFTADIKALVDGAPPLSPEQKNKLAMAMLRLGGGPDDTAA